MAYLFSYGCDAQMDMSQKFSIIDANAAIVADGGKFGVGTDSLKLIDDADFNTLTMPSTAGILGDTTSPFHMSFYVKLAADPVADRVLVQLIQGGSSNGCALVVGIDGALSMTLWTLSSSISTTKITTTAGNISDGGWHHIEFKFVEDSVSGIYKLWINGVIATDFSGNTLNNTPITTGISNVRVYGAGNVTDTEFDDILIWDEEGTSMNTSGQLGLTRIETLIPNGAGNSTQFTAVGAASNYLAVDEEGADDNTTYVHSATATNKDLYTYTDMAGAPATIQGIALQSRITNSDIGAISMKPMARSNVTELAGTTTAVSAGGVYSQNVHFYPLDPDGSIAWTKTKVNAAEFGIEVV